MEKWMMNRVWNRPKKVGENKQFQITRRGFNRNAVALKKHEQVWKAFHFGTGVQNSKKSKTPKRTGPRPEDKARTSRQWSDTQTSFIYCPSDNKTPRLHQYKAATGALLFSFHSSSYLIISRPGNFLWCYWGIRGRYVNEVLGYLNPSQLNTSIAHVALITSSNIQTEFSQFQQPRRCLSASPVVQITLQQVAAAKRKVYEMFVVFTGN